MLLPAAVSAHVEWLATEYDYGSFREASGPKTGSVRFVNKGPEPTFISSVRPSCGCTGAAYTEDMIQPGDTATVSFIYNPIGRPGRFDKTVKVYIGKEKELKVIRIKGTVIGTPETLESSFPYSAGPLRLEKLEMSAGRIVKGGSRHLFMNVYNQSEDTIRPAWVNHNKGIEVELTPSEIPPGEIGTFGFYLRTPAEKRMGPVSYTIRLTADANDPHSETKDVTVGAMIAANPNEIMDGAVSEKGIGGRCSLLPEFVDLGEVEGTKPLKFSFVIANDGDAPLDVQRVYCSDVNVRLKKEKGRVKPLNKEKFEGELDVKGLPAGPFRINIGVMSTDRLHPEKSVKIVGEKR